VLVSLRLSTLKEYQSSQNLHKSYSLLNKFTSANLKLLAGTSLNNLCDFGLTVTFKVDLLIFDHLQKGVKILGQGRKEFNKQDSKTIWFLLQHLNSFGFLSVVAKRK